MRSKILKSIFSVAAAVLLASLLLITGVLYQYFGAVQQTQLADELDLAAKGTEELGEAYLEKLDSVHYRLTWIAQDGTVLFDNHIESEQMENHANREEIKEAFDSGIGSSSRYSTTLTEQTIYKAVRLKDGSVLRISESRVTAVVLVLGMIQPIALIILIAFLLSVWLAGRMAKKIVEPLNQLNLDKPLENDAYEELSPLLRRIHSQQKKIREQMRTLKRKQDEFDQITGNMKEAMILLDHTEKIVSINPAACRWFEEEDGKGKDFLLINRKQNMRTAVGTAWENGTASFRENRNGREYQFELNRIESEGSVLGMVILGFDITEQVNAEQNRREFTANVSHELKTPLQSIIGSAELLENGIVQRQDVPRFVSHIRKEATRLVSLIEDIIRLSQLDEGAEMAQDEVVLHEVAEEVFETLADEAKKKNITMDLTGSSGSLKGVRRLFYEIIYNLCDNAVKYNHSGGSVHVSIEEDQKTVQLRVKDTGIGVAPEYQEKIFERFYRVDKSHSRQSGGTGLGLSIVKHAVQYHHGRISIKSALNQGTEIAVSFDKIQNS